MYVKNIGGTSGYSSPCTCCDTWIGHWRKWTGSRRSTCAIAGCSGKAVGAHVRKSRSTDQRWYIVPICHRHNMSGSELSVKVELVHVRACR